MVGVHGPFSSSRVHDDDDDDDDDDGGDKDSLDCVIESSTLMLKKRSTCIKYFLIIPTSVTDTDRNQ